MAAHATLVTGLFDLARHEGNPHRRPVERYLLEGEFLFNLDEDVIFFVEPDLCEAVERRRRAHGLARRSTIVPTRLADLPFFDLVERVRAARRQHPIVDSSPFKDTPEHAVLMWSKLTMVERAVELDPVGASRFAWIDFGIGHVARTEHCVEDGVFGQVPERIKLMMIRPIGANGAPRSQHEVYTRLPWAVAGGFISGGKPSLLRLAARFAEEARAALDAGYGPIDEQILLRLIVREPDLFELYGGDYRDILANYVRVRGSVPILFKQALAWRSAGNHRAACELGARVLASHRAGILDVSPQALARFLELYFTSAYYLEAPRQDTARAVADYYAALVHSEPGFAAAFRAAADRVVRDFSFLASPPELPGPPVLPEPPELPGPPVLPVLPEPPVCGEPGPPPIATAPAPLPPAEPVATPAPRPEGRPRICLNMIVKDEAAIIERCLRSVLPVVDCYVICDTGSQDDTVARITALLEGHGKQGKIHHIRFKNFEHARNRALSLCRAARLEFDYILLADADMELVIDDPAALDRLREAAYLVRQHSGISYSNVRLIRRDSDARYVGVTHEHVASGEPSVPLRGIWFRDHACGSSRVDKQRRDIRLLRAGLRREPDNARYMFYLAQSYREAGRLRDAIAWYQRRIAAGGWDEEVWYAAYMVARCWSRIGDEAQFVEQSLAAYQRRPGRAEPLYWLARHYRLTRQHEACMLLCEAGLQIPYPEADRLFIEDRVYGTGFREEASITGYYCRSEARRRAGYRACVELMTSRTADHEVRGTARRNALFYLRSATELLGAHDARELHVPCLPGYTATNPSIWIDDAARCVVRTVNYTVEKMAYTINDRDRLIRTQNYLVDLDEERQVTRVRPMTDAAPSVERFDFPVKGFEDCRLFRCRGRLWCSCTVRDTTPDGRCQIAVLELDDEARVTGVHVQRLHPEQHQKNWLPLVRGRELLFIYSSDPTELLRFDFETMQAAPYRTHQPAFGIDGFRGSSQAIPANDGWLYLAHEAVQPEPTRRHYLHRFVLLDAELRIQRVSEPFYFLKSGIEFCAGLARDERRHELIASFGVDDRHAFLIRFPEARVMQHLEETGR